LTNAGHGKAFPTDAEARRYIFLAAFILSAAALVVGWNVVGAFARARAGARSKECMSNLKQIGLALTIYANDHDRLFPPTLDALMPYYLTDETLLRCPSRLRGKQGYLYVPGLTSSSSPGTIVAFDKLGNHGGVRHVLFVDSHVMLWSEEEFQNLYEEQRTKYNLPSLAELGDKAAP
jgi:prepilin-type processing-associated H-X9-DG protein